MNKTPHITFALLLIFASSLCGCATLKGPISGKTYIPLLVTEPISNNPSDCHKYYSDTMPDSENYKKECRRYLVNKNPSWSQEIKNKILDGKISIGMTKEQAIVSWGNPKDINRTVVGSGVHEQWVYGSQFLYFDNGILTSFQDF